MPSKKSKTEKAEWTYQGSKDFEVPELAIGFVYRIDVIGTPFYYYGKKNLTSTRGRGKKKVTKESTWRTYESSSKEIKELIKAGKKIKKQILEFAYSKSELTLLETKQIICFVSFSVKSDLLYANSRICFFIFLPDFMRAFNSNELPS